MKAKYMKTIKSTILIIVIVLTQNHAEAQGFINLDFESANISGYTPGSSDVPISAAIPGWTGSYGNNQTTQVCYDGISIGGAVISVIDDNAPVFQPLQGNFSVFLFGGGGGGPSASISQTGTIPAGTESILMDAWTSDASPVVAIDGQPINMVAVQAFANYTLYAGDVSAYAGQAVTLSFTDPPPSVGGPSMFELDDIAFSPNTVPEPNTLALVVMGGAAFGLRRWRMRANAARQQKLN
jgi:hypothetical protein